MDHRLLLVCGSLRKGWANHAALTTMAQVAPDGVRTSVFDALDSLPHFNPDEDHDGDALHPAVARSRAAIAAADVLVFCTPEYAGALPGSFKNALDWTVGGVAAHLATTAA